MMNDIRRKRSLAIESTPVTPDVKQSYAAHDVVPYSGIYRAVHVIGHHLVQYITCIEESIFPPCPHCGNLVVFELVQAAIYVEDDSVFHPPTMPHSPDVF